MAVIYGKSMKWTKTTLTWAFTNTVDAPGLSQDQANVEFQKACDLWSPSSGLTFEMTKDSSTADIPITWKTVDKAGDILAFVAGQPNGTDNPLAMSFDTSEEWTKNNFVLSAANFLSVALHELGHVIGLDHSANPDAVMYPIIGAFVPRTTLSTDDSDGATYLYKELDQGIFIVNETDQYVSWFAFNSYDIPKLTALWSGNLAPNEFRLYQPVKNDTGEYFIRFTNNGGGTELAGAIVADNNLVNLMLTGSFGFFVEVTG
jgi:hypothetical protein